MADVAAAKRYAQAAFGIARDSGTLATWRAELADVAAVLADSQFAPVLANASLPIETRLAMVERTLAVSPMVLNLAKLLVQKGRSLMNSRTQAAIGSASMMPSIAALRLAA